MELIESGIPGMDSLTNGGLPKNRTLLISGSCGTGKSTFAAQFIYHGLKQGKRCVYVTFEEGKDKLKENLAQYGIDFDAMEKRGLLRIIGGSIGDIRFYKEKTKANAHDIADEIKEVANEIKTSRIVIDSVNLYLMLFDDDNARRHAMAALTSTLEKLNNTTLMTCEVKEGTRDISWYGFEEFVVDGVIALYRVPFENMFERAISVIKMRGVKHSPNIVALQIREDGIHVFPTKSPFHKILN